jgi:hypothetical protein
VESTPKNTVEAVAHPFVGADLVGEAHGRKPVGKGYCAVSIFNEDMPVDLAGWVAEGHPELESDIPRAWLVRCDDGLYFGVHGVGVCSFDELCFHGGLSPDEMKCLGYVVKYAGKAMGLALEKLVAKHKAGG